MASGGGSASNARRVVGWILALALGFALLAPFDAWLYHASIDFKVFADSKLREPIAMCRTTGYLPLWWLLAIGFALVARARRGRGDLSQAALSPAVLAASPTLAAIAAELLKLLTRRLRPSKTDGAYAFRAFSDGPLDGRGLGLPSSEAAVAFGAAFVLARAYPAAWPLWLFFATGSAFSRMYEGKHFATDVFTGALVGIACAYLVEGWARRRERRAQAN